MLKVTIYNSVSNTSEVELVSSHDDIPFDRWLQLGLVITVQVATDEDMSVQ